MKVPIQGSAKDPYIVDTKELTCTCPHFRFRGRHYPKDSESRLCKHIHEAFEKHPELNPRKVSSTRPSNSSVGDDGKVRFPRSIFDPYVVDSVAVMNTFSDLIIKHEVCGSYRRLKSEVSDLDILVVLKEGQSPDPFLNYLEGVLGYHKLWRGDKKASYKVDGLVQIDFKFVPMESWPFSTLHYTGSKEENINMRRKSISLGYSLSEYGLRSQSTGDYVEGIDSERGIYEFLQMTYKEPWNR